MLISEPDVTAKAELAEESFWGYVGGREQFEETRTTFRRGAAEDDEGLALLSIAARDADEKKVGRKFWNAGMEMALSNYPGFQLANSSRAASAITVYWPALISSACIDERVFHTQRDHRGCATSTSNSIRRGGDAGALGERSCTRTPWRGDPEHPARANRRCTFR